MLRCTLCWLQNLNESHVEQVRPVDIMDYVDSRLCWISTFCWYKIVYRWYKLKILAGDKANVDSPSVISICSGERILIEWPKGDYALRWNGERPMLLKRAKILNYTCLTRNIFGLSAILPINAITLLLLSAIMFVQNQAVCLLLLNYSYGANLSLCIQIFLQI